MHNVTANDLKRIRKDALRSVKLRNAEGRATITVHMGECGIKAGARKVMKALLAAIGDQGIEDVLVFNADCAGLCDQEPMATVRFEDTEPVRYGKLDSQKIVRILNEHALNGLIVKEYRC